MNDIALDPDFEPRIADWLEDDPDRAPDAVLETVLAAFPSIPQRRALRAPWRLTSMNRFMLAGAATATIVAIAFGGSLLVGRPPDIGRSPAPSPSTRASTAPSGTPLPTPATSGVPALTQTATTASGDLTVRYPADWTELGSYVSADGGAIGGEFGPDPTGPPQAFFAGSSVPLAVGESPEAWITKQPVCDGQCDGQCSTPSEIPIGGRVGTLISDECPILGSRWHHLAVIVVNGRGYTFHMDSRSSTIDRTWFAAMLEAVSFGP